jgi:hypothetical protein
VTYENKVFIEPKGALLGPNRIKAFIVDFCFALNEILKRKSGTATITAAATSVVVTHGYGATPAAEDIHVTPTLLSSSAKWWVSTIGATTFTINVDVVPGGGTATFAWKISRY